MISSVLAAEAASRVPRASSSTLPLVSRAWADDIHSAPPAHSSQAAAQAVSRQDGVDRKVVS